MRDTPSGTPKIEPFWVKKTQKGSFWLKKGAKRTLWGPGSTPHTLCGSQFPRGTPLGESPLRRRWVQKPQIFLWDLSGVEKTPINPIGKFGLKKGVWEGLRTNVHRHIYHFVHFCWKSAQKWGNLGSGRLFGSKRLKKGHFGSKRAILGSRRR